MITEKMWLKRVKNKINRQYKGDLQAFKYDMLLVFNNAMTYNQDGSVFYNNAQTMRDRFLELWSEQMRDLGLDEDGNAPPQAAAPPSPVVPAPKKLTLKLKTGGARPPPPAKAPARTKGRKKAVSSSEEEEESELDDESDDE